jgi:hypothetical protein
MIHCIDCGNQISERAKNCPKCGAPNKAKGKSTLVLALLTAVVFVFGLLFFVSNKGSADTVMTREQKLELADQLIANNCQTLANMAVEYITNDIGAAVVKSLIGLKCDCMREKLREKMADKFTLFELHRFGEQPIHQIVEIKTLIQENHLEVLDCYPVFKRILKRNHRASR